MNTVRVVFEKGLELRRTQDGAWFFQSVRGEKSGTVPAAVTSKYGVRPVLVTERLPSGSELTFLLATKGKQILEREYHELISIADAKDDIPVLFFTFNLSYVAGAVCYHCKRLAETYSEICHAFAHLPFSGEHESDRATFGYQPEPYYEFDALITAAFRLYDTARYIIWRAFGPPKSPVPRSLEKTLPLCKGLPTILSDRLSLSWSQFGKKVKDYRDCIQHYVPVNRWVPYAEMVRLENGVWSTSILIPDNPRVRSQKQFRDESHLDALTYGWELTNEVLEVTRAIVNEVPDKESSR